MKRGLLNMMLTALTAASLAGCVHDNLVQIEELSELAFDESEGDLVYFAPSSGSLDEQDLHDRIYVTVNEPGNAVIVAYDDDPDTNEYANIIWSWHIWVPDADEPDPTNASNGLPYYTYAWDSTGIYGYKDADGNETGNQRIPGYTIMNLNLGALGSYPPSSGSRESINTYGMLYQWGAKTPSLGQKGP